MTSVIVVGGGIAGLAAARELAMAGVSSVTVLEGSARWGGKLAGVAVDGLRLDTGAESMLARRPEAVGLVDELGLSGRLVHPTSAKSQVLVGGQVRALPPSALGVPRDLDLLVGYLTPEGLQRARQEHELPAPALAGDVGIGRYVDERFGPEVTDRLLEPLLGGVYAGQARRLSFAAVSPALFERARHGGSLLQHAAGLTATTAQGPVFAGLVGGVATLVDALVADLARRGVTLRSGVTVRELSADPDGGYRLVCGAVPQPEMLRADAVVLAVPAAPAGRLLAPLTDVGREFGAIPYASVAVVTMVLRGAALTGSGLLVPPGELPTVKALTYSSTKWDWVGAQAEEVWGPGVSVVRASVGRVGEEQLLQLDDDALLARTWAEARALPGWPGAELVAGQVTRWGGGLPQYLVGHRDLVARIHVALAERPGLSVCGAALDGVGVAACLASATAAAAKVVQDLRTTDRGRRGDATTIEGQLLERRS